MVSLLKDYKIHSSPSPGPGSADAALEAQPGDVPYPFSPGVVGGHLEFIQFFPRQFIIDRYPLLSTVSFSLTAN